MSNAHNNTTQNLVIEDLSSDLLDDEMDQAGDNDFMSEVVPVSESVFSERSSSAPSPMQTPAPASEPPSSPSHLASVVLLNALSVDPGDTPNRLNASFDSDEFFLLRESIMHTRGNVQPIIVRELSGAEIQHDSPYRYRLISGARRLRACALDTLPVLAIVQKTLREQDLIDRLVENQLRENLSPYELGLQLQHILAATRNTSRRALARLAGLDVSVVQKALDIAALPDEVIASFGSPADIQYRDAKPLKDSVALSRDAVVACAASLIGKGLSSKEVVTRLTSAAESTVAGQDGSGGQSGVEPFNTEHSPISLVIDGQAVGTMALDKKGLPEIRLAIALSPRLHAELAKQIEKFLRSKVLKPAVGKPRDAQAANVTGATTVVVEQPVHLEMSAHELPLASNEPDVKANAKEQA